MTDIYDDSMPLGSLTIGAFKEMMREILSERHEEKTEINDWTEKRYVFGLKGIRDLFGVSHATAQRLKDGVLQPAVHQSGRKIVTDVDLAMKLFSGKDTR